MKAFRFARLSLAVSLVVMLALALFPASSAFAAATSMTFNDKGVQTFTDFVPCGLNPGVLYDITSTYTNVFHLTTNSNGSWATFTEQAQVVAVPEGSGPTFTGHYTTWDGENVNNQNSNFTSTFTVILQGSDGSTVKFHDVAHWSISAAGGIVTFDKPICN